jgi:hypothetical protein
LQNAFAIHGEVVRGLERTTADQPAITAFYPILPVIDRFCDRDDQPEKVGMRLAWVDLLRA